MTENNVTSSAALPAPLRIAGLGVPLIDFITPQPEELDAAEATLAQLHDYITHTPLRYEDAKEKETIAKAATDGPQHIREAREALAAFHHFWQEEQHFDEGVTKKTLTPEDAERVAAWFETVLVAARDVNAAALFMGEPQKQLLVRHMGGTMYNKFHAIGAAMGDRVSTHMLGALGDEDESGNRKRMVDNLKASNLDFQELNDISLGNMGVSYIIPHKGDRIVLKAPIKALSANLGTHQDEIAQFVTNPDKAADMYFIEGSDYASGKFGAESFVTFAEAAMPTGKPIVFSAPTDTGLVLGDSPAVRDARRQMDRLINHHATTLLTMNEEEAVAMFCNAKFEKQEGVKPQDHPQIKAALEEMTARLKAKAEVLKPNETEPLAFVSAGSTGGFFVTQRGAQFVPCEKAKPLSTIGAGDAFASGVFVEYIKRRDALLESGKQEFSDADLTAITVKGQALGRECIAHKGAQPPQVAITTAFHGHVPTRGALVHSGIPPFSERQIG